MNKTLNIGNAISAAFAILLIGIGILNLLWVHPVPACGYWLLSLVYLPGTNAVLKQQLGYTIPSLLKIIFAAVLLLFTLGVSDLGNIIDKW